MKFTALFTVLTVLGAAGPALSVPTELQVRGQQVDAKAPGVSAQVNKKVITAPNANSVTLQGTKNTVATNEHTVEKDVNNAFVSPGKTINNMINHPDSAVKGTMPSVGVSTQAGVKSNLQARDLIDAQGQVSTDLASNPFVSNDQAIMGADINSQNFASASLGISLSAAIIPSPSSTSSIKASQSSVKPSSSSHSTTSHSTHSASPTHIAPKSSSAKPSAPHPTSKQPQPSPSNPADDGSNGVFVNPPASQSSVGLSQIIGAADGGNPLNVGLQSNVIRSSNTDQVSGNVSKASSVPKVPYGKLPDHTQACDGKSHTSGDLVEVCITADLVSLTPKGYSPCPNDKKQTLHAHDNLGTVVGLFHLCIDAGAL